MNDPEGRFIYPTLLLIGLALAVLFPLSGSSKSHFLGAKISIMLLGMLVMAWAVCGILTDTSSIAFRLSEGGTIVIYNIRRFLGGVATGIFVCLALTGNLKPKRSQSITPVSSTS
jgi:hypothetical protein